LGLTLAMDNPLGPRQPDKRHAAYESIFGRPNHHHQGPPPSNYPQSLHPQPVHQPYMYQQQQYQGTVDGRTSNVPPYVPSVHSQSMYQQQGLPATYRQSYYPSVSPQPPHLPYNAYPPHFPGSYGHPPSSLSPQSVPGRASSTLSNPYATGIIASQPEEPPDPNLEELTQSGLTPAQAYQAQVYLNSPAGPQGDWSRYRRSSPAPPDRNSHPQTQNGGPSHATELPRLGVTLEHDDGRVVIEPGGSGNSSDQGTDEGSSELPWARKDRPRESPILRTHRHNAF
jgi:hypothetical protein